MTLIHSDIDDIQKNEFKVEYTQGSWQLKNLFSNLLKKNFSDFKGEFAVLRAN